MTTSSRLAVLLFTDIVGSTDLKARIGAPAYASILDRHNAIFEGICREQKGEVLKHTGDGFFAAFATASDAVRTALRFQHAMRTEPWATPLTSRVGIHVGEVAAMQMAGRADVIGIAADVAAHVMSLAAGGQVLLTRSAFNDARQFVAEHPPVNGEAMPPLRWIAHGPYLFNGVEEPLEVFEVGADGAAPLTAPTGGVKARRVVPHDQEPTLGWRPAVGLPIPQRPGWALERRLGEGGFGEVWLGSHERTKQRRVFKFCFDADRLRSFKRELTLFRLLREALGERPDIARLYEVKLDEPPFFLESEWTEGGNLVDWSEARGGIATIPLEQRLEIVARVAEAVAAAHSVGILHKDIKPSNVLVQELPGGGIQPRLADFGIGFLSDRSQLAARHITETGFTVITQTSGSSMTGTRLYAPPEVIAGKAFTTQGDIYALGVLLYQMAVGDLSRPLAAGWEREVADDLLRQDIAACCDGDPNRRPSGAGEIAQRIRALPERREMAREQALHAQSAEKRQRLLRRSIAGSVLMGLLVVTIAGSSAFYIRRVRAAQLSETTQRQRAQDAEKSAQDEAARATRLAAYYLAQYDLSALRVKDAYEQALKANVAGARWEDGHLLQEVVSAARQNWDVVGRIGDPSLATEFGPGQGCFVRRDKKWALAAPRGTSVELYSVPQGDRLGTISCAAVIGSVCPGAEDRLLIASGKTVMLWDIMAMKQLATAQEDAIITQVVARPNATVIATLDGDGRIHARFTADLALTPGKQQRLSAREQRRVANATGSNIDLSPSGKYIVGCSGLGNEDILLWDWQADTVTPVKMNAHAITIPDDRLLVGYVSWGSGTDETTVFAKPLGKIDAPPQAFYFNNLLARASPRIISVWYERQTGQTCIAMVGAEGVDLRTFPGGLFVTSDLYSSILPLCKEPVRVVAHDVRNNNLALAADGQVLLLSNYFPSRWQKPLKDWSMASCARGMLTCVLIGHGDEDPEVRLTLTPFDGAPSKTFDLAWPPASGRTVMPWGIWAPPDGSFVAVLRQETEQGARGGTIGAKYFGKSIAIYDTNGWSDATPWKIKRQILLPQFDQIDGRDNRFISLTPDGQVAVLSTQGSPVARYRVSDGTLVSRDTTGTWATPSQDGRLVASGGGREQPVIVRDVASGSAFFTLPVQGNARRACFSSDGRYLYVGSLPAKLTGYDLSKGGAVVKSLTTPVLPVAVPTSGKRFVGFLPDTPTTGNTVLASLVDGEVTAVLNRGAHIQNTAWFDATGLRVALLQRRDAAWLICSLTPAEARAALDPTTLAPGATPTTVPSVVAEMPRPTNSTTNATTIPWADAGSYAGKDAVVQATIVSTTNIGSRCFLNVTRERGSFTFVLNPPTFKQWPEPPEKWFLNKTIRVSGKVELYRGVPEIVVEDASQIEVVEIR